MRQINWDVVTLGRVLGIAIIVAGTALVAWEASTFPDNLLNQDSNQEWRYFLQRVLSYLGSGGLLIVAAEIADRLGWRAADVVDEETALEPPDSAASLMR